MAGGFVCSSVSYQRLDFVLSFTYQTSCAMNARSALPAADLIVGTMRWLLTCWWRWKREAEHASPTKAMKQRIGQLNASINLTFSTGPNDSQDDSAILFDSELNSFLLLTAPSRMFCRAVAWGAEQAAGATRRIQPRRSFTNDGIHPWSRSWPILLKKSRSSVLGSRA
jgi:hypothetical protein